MVIIIFIYDPLNEFRINIRRYIGEEKSAYSMEYELLAFVCFIHPPTQNTPLQLDAIFGLCNIRYRFSARHNKFTCVTPVRLLHKICIAETTVPHT